MIRFLTYVLIAIGTFLVGLGLSFLATSAQRGGEQLARFWRDAITQSVTGNTGWARAGKDAANTAPPAHDPKTVGQQDDVRPILPRDLVAIVDQELSLYFDGLVLARDPEEYRFAIEDDGLGGMMERRRWHLTPRAKQIGLHRLVVTVSDWNGKRLADGSTSLHVVAPGPVARRANILIVGGSNTHQSLYMNLLWTLLDTWSPGKVRFIGTHRPKPDRAIYREPLPQVAHEGYGGWGWHLFATHYLPGQEAYYKVPRSPFVYLEGGKPTLSVGRYLDERGIRGALDAVVFDLGINETFSANPDDPPSLDATIRSTLDWADKLIQAFRVAAPEAKVVIVIPTPFTRSEPVFRRRYAEIRSDFGDPWRHRRIVETLARRMVEHFDGHDPAVTLIPMHAMFDTVDGYWVVDPGHPNEQGGKQMAAGIFATLADVLSRRTR
ncbi:MAG: SGNH/GDSL hydrolase family protein [Candidatus Methylomirabilis sp.]